MDATKVFPSKHIKAEDLGDKKPVLLIESIEFEEFGQGEKREEKPVLYFHGKEKGFACNKTNWKTVMGLYGTETDAWLGKPIQLCTAVVDYKGEAILSIRVVPMKPALPAPPAPQKAAAAPADDMAEDDIPF